MIWCKEEQETKQIIDITNKENAGESQCAGRDTPDRQGRLIALASSQTDYAGHPEGCAGFSFAPG